MIHSTALVDASAQIADDVEVGPFSVIGSEVKIGPGSWIGHHVVIEGPTSIGRDNKIHPFNSLGGPPQDKKFRGERSVLEVGDRNTVREYCTLNRGTELGGKVTRIGSDNWIMAYVHVAHDCAIGSGCVLANGATLAGHVVLGNNVTLGASTVIHQFCAIGDLAFSAMGTVIFKDVPPFVTVSGNSATPHGVNAEGLRRAGRTSEEIQTLRRAYKTLYKKGLILDKALQEMKWQEAESADIVSLVNFIEDSTRGLVR